MNSLVRFACLGYKALFYKWWFFIVYWEMPFCRKFPSHVWLPEGKTWKNKSIPGNVLPPQASPIRNFLTRQSSDDAFWLVHGWNWLPLRRGYSNNSRGSKSANFKMSLNIGFPKPQTSVIHRHHWQVWCQFLIHLTPIWRWTSRMDSQGLLIQGWYDP